MWIEVLNHPWFEIQVFLSFSELMFETGGLIRFDKLASSYAMLQCILASYRNFIFLSIKHQVNVIHTFSSHHAEWKGIFFFMILHTLLDSIRSGCAWLERNMHEKIKKCSPWKGDSCRKVLVWFVKVQSSVIVSDRIGSKFNCCSQRLPI